MATLIDLNELLKLVIDPEHVWVNYDDESDSVTMFFADEPVRSRAIPITDYLNVLVDPQTKEIVGVMFEAWELKIVPSLKSVKTTWPEVRPNLVAGWSVHLQMLLLWVMTIIQLHPERSGLSPQPA